jgi:hypothetical protein
MNQVSPRAVQALRRALPLAAVGALGALVAVVATGAAARTAPAPSPAAPKSHLGAAARDHVVLALSGTAPPRTFRRVLKDGKTEAAQFVVPRGSALHVTDVEYVAGWNQNGRGPGQRVVRLEIVNDLDPLKRAPVAFVAPLPSGPPDPGSTIFGVGGGRATTGFVVGAGAHLEVDAPEFLLPATGDTVPQPFHGDVVVRGYLVKDK